MQNHDTRLRKLEARAPGQEPAIVFTRGRTQAEIDDDLAAARAAGQTVIVVRYVVPNLSAGSGVEGAESR